VSGRAAGDLGEDVQDRGRRHRPALRRHEPRERAAVEVIEHHEPRPAVGHALDVVDTDQVAMAEPGGGARLVDEPGDDRGILGELRIEDLDRVQILHQRVFRQINTPHSALAQQAQHHEWPDLAACLHGPKLASGARERAKISLTPPRISR
jgi:hypothetical protein